MVAAVAVVVAVVVEVGVVVKKVEGVVQLQWCWSCSVPGVGVLSTAFLTRASYMHVTLSPFLKRSLTS